MIKLCHHTESLHSVDTLTRLVDTTDITIIPTINPDGFDRGTEGACSGADYKTGRYNEGNRDLNRDFPTVSYIRHLLALTDLLLLQ